MTPILQMTKQRVLKVKMNDLPHTEQPGGLAREARASQLQGHLPSTQPSWILGKVRTRDLACHIAKPVDSTHEDMTSIRMQDQTGGHEKTS